MKKHFINLLLLLSAALCLTACSDDEVPVPKPLHASGSRSIIADGFEVSTSNPTLLTNWENVNIIYIPNANNILQHVDAPWSNNGPISNLNQNFRHDIKKEDGWTMLFHTFKDAYSSVGQSYMVFYNLFTGTLKVFYYSFATDGTNTQWLIKSNDGNTYQPDASHKMFYVPSYFSKANSETTDCKDTGVAISNQINIENTGLAKGWNGFEYKIAQYSSEDLNHDFLITAVNNTIFNADFEGFLTQDISGNIKSVTIPETKGKNNTSNSTNSVAIIGGATAENYISGLYQYSDTLNSRSASLFSGILMGAFKSLAGQLAKKGLSELLKKGLGALFGQTSEVTIYNTTSDVSLSAEGSVRLQGTVDSSSSSQVSSVNFNLGAILNGQSNTANGSALVYNASTSSTSANLSNLGVWCVKNRPAVYFDLLKPYYAEVTTDLESNEPLEVSGRSSFPTVSYGNIDIIFNPAIQQYITSYTVDKKYFFAQIDGRSYSLQSFTADPAISDKVFSGDTRELFQEPVWGTTKRFSVLCDMASNVANSDSQYYYKWKMPTNGDMIVLVTVTMNINYMGKTRTVTESRIFEVDEREQPSMIRHNPPAFVVLNNGGTGWAY